MSTYQISCTVGTTDPLAQLGLEIWVDDRRLFDDYINQESLPLKFDLDEDEAEHELRFIMKGKTLEHTKISEAGEIIKDASLTINELAFDSIGLNQIFFENAVYIHNFNGTQPEIKDKFYDTMGCNGTVSMRFDSPVYIWLLEKM